LTTETVDVRGKSVNKRKKVVNGNNFKTLTLKVLGEKEPSNKPTGLAGWKN
jgi:hypothetical protein